MASYEAIREAAAEYLDLQEGATEDEIRAEYRGKVVDYHPDTSDRDDAEERFKALESSKDILIGNIDPTERSRLDTVERQLSQFVDIDQSGGVTQGATTSGEATEEDIFDTFFGEVDDEVAMASSRAVKIDMVYEATQSLYRPDVTTDDFVEAVMEYEPDQENGMRSEALYWEAARPLVAEQVSEELFHQAWERMEQKVGEQYGGGTDIDQIAMVVGQLIARGSSDIGDPSQFVHGPGAGFTRNRSGFGGGGSGFTRSRDGFSR